MALLCSCQDWTLRHPVPLLDLAVQADLPPKLVKDAGADGRAAAADHAGAGEVGLGDGGVQRQHRHQRRHYRQVVRLVRGQATRKIFVVC